MYLKALAYLRSWLRRDLSRSLALPTRRRPEFEILESRLAPAIDMWNVDSSGNFNDGTNWSLHAPPGPNDTAIINPTGSVTVTIDSAAQVQSLQVGSAGSAETLVLGSGGSLTVAGSLDNFGTITETGSDLRIGYGATLTNEAGALFDMQGDGAEVLGDINLSGTGATAQSTFINRGVLRRSASPNTAGIAPRLGPFAPDNGNLSLENDGGTIDVETGALALSPDALTNNGGNFTVAAGATLDFLGTQNIHPVVTGTFTATAGSRGSVVINGDGSGNDSIIANAAVFDFPAGMATLSSSQLDGGTNTGALIWTNGAVGLINKGTLTLAGPGTRYAYGVDNLGMIAETGGELRIGQGIGLTNESSGTVDLQGDGAEVHSDLGGPSSTSTFLNRGLLRRSVSVGTASIATLIVNGNHQNNLAFDNEGGTVDVQTGTLVFSPNDFTNNGGNLTVAGGADLQFLATNDVSPTLSGAFGSMGGGTVEVTTNYFGGSVVINVGNSTFDFAPGVLTFSGATITGGTNLGFLTWTSGAIGLINKGTITVAGAGPMYAGDVDNFGTITETGSGLRIEVGATLTNEASGTFDLRGDGNEVLGDGGAGGGSSTSTFLNRGVLRRSVSLNNATLTPLITRSFPADWGNLTFDNDGGTIDMRTGTLTFSTNTFNNNGSFIVAGGADLQFLATNDVSPTLSGTFSSTGSGTVEVTTNYFGGPVVINVGSSTFNFAPGILTFSGASIAGGTNTGTLTWTSGAAGLTNKGTITLAGSAYASGVDNFGTIIQTGGYLRVGQGIGLTNESTGTIDLQSDGASIQSDLGGPSLTSTFVNRGRLRRWVSVGTASIATLFVNGNHQNNLAFDNEGGTVDVETGTLAFSPNDFVNNGGSLIVAGGADLQFLATSDVSPSLSGGFSSTGSGSVEVTTNYFGGTVVINVGSSTFNFAPGILTFSGAIIDGGINTGALAWASGEIDGLVNHGTLTISGAAGSVYTGGLDNAGTIIETGLPLGINPGGTLTNEARGVFDIQADGNVVYAAGTPPGPSTFNNLGTLEKTSGTGTSNLSQITLLNSGTVSPGESGRGTLAVTGNYVQTDTGTLAIDLGGTMPSSQFDQLAVGGTATLAGTLSVDLVNSFTPAPGNTFPVVTFTSRSGSFGTLHVPALGGGLQFDTAYHAADASLVVDSAPAFTSTPSTTFTAGTAGTFTVAASGFPAPVLSKNSGDVLPSGVSFDATGVLNGTPAPNSGGTYTLHFSAANGVGTNATQTFTLTVDQAAAITSPASTTFTTGTAGSFTVTATGFPAPTLSANGSDVLPTGVTFGAGTGIILSGTPVGGSGGMYTLHFTAHNGIGTDASQTFTLSVGQPPAFTSANTTTFTVGTAGSFLVTPSGFPAPTLSESAGDTLPNGVTFNAATGMLSGMPAVGSGGNYTLRFTAHNGVGADATQTVLLTVNQPPTWILATGTNSDHATFRVGTAFSLPLAASGSPAPTVSESPGDVLPNGVSFNPLTGILSGTPAPGSGGTYTLHFTARNGVGADATQTVVLTVQPVVTARLVRMRHKKVLLEVFEDGKQVRAFRSPLQPPAFKNIQVSVHASNGDGVPDQVVLTARKRKKTVTVSFPG
jgi:hypothetical protein